MEADAGEYIKKHLHLKRFPRIRLHCKLVPVQYWEYDYGLLKAPIPNGADLQVLKFTTNFKPFSFQFWWWVSI